MDVSISSSTGSEKVLQNLLKRGQFPGSTSVYLDYVVVFSNSLSPLGGLRPMGVTESFAQRSVRCSRKIFHHSQASKILPGVCHLLLMVHRRLITKSSQAPHFSLCRLHKTIYCLQTHDKLDQVLFVPKNMMGWKDYLHLLEVFM